jgi:hypothetical protein
VLLGARVPLAMHTTKQCKRQPLVHTHLLLRLNNVYLGSTNLHQHHNCIAHGQQPAMPLASDVVGHPGRTQLHPNHYCPTYSQHSNTAIKQAQQAMPENVPTHNHSLGAYINKLLTCLTCSTHSLSCSTYRQKHVCGTVTSITCTRIPHLCQRERSYATA